VLFESVFYAAFGGTFLYAKKSRGSYDTMFINLGDAAVETRI